MLTFLFYHYYYYYFYLFSFSFLFLFAIALLNHVPNFLPCISNFSYSTCSTIQVKFFHITYLPLELLAFRERVVRGLMLIFEIEAQVDDEESTLGS